MSSLTLKQIRDPQTGSWVAYVGPFMFPDTAAGKRVLGNAVALSTTNNKVYVVSPKSDSASEVLPKFESQGIWHVPIEPIHEKNSNGISRFFELVSMAVRTRRWITSQSSQPKAIIIYSGYLPYLLILTRWARHRNVPVIFDAVEWYAPTSSVRFLLSPYHLMIDFTIRVLIPRLDGVIAISNALREYFQGRGVPTVVVPPTLSTNDVSCSSTPMKRAPTEFVYAGHPGNKDLLDTIIEAFVELDPTGDVVRLHVAGPSEEDVRALPSLKRWTGVASPGSIQPHGYLTSSDTFALVRYCDYSVLLRSRTRVSRHGFATKFVESFAVGTPVVANRTGDLRKHLKDSKNGFACWGADVESLKSAIQRACTVDSAAYSKLCGNAREEAVKNFDSGRYSQSLEEFIATVIDRRTRKQ